MTKLYFFYTLIRRACSLLFIFFIFCKANATTYYVSAQGNDASNGTSPSTPWLSIPKVNATAFKPGDAILFNRGETFYGTITVSRSGSPGNFIVYGAYGNGALPIITGFTHISNWKNDGGGIYECTCTTCQSSLNMVTFQDTLQPMGRWPKLTAANEGYLAVDSHMGVTSITSSGLSGALNYVGGEIVSRKFRWILDRARIITQSSNTITCRQLPYLFPGTFYNFCDTHGFFIQNHVNACTQIGEWAYDSAAKKIKMFFGASPASYNVQASTIDYLVSISAQNYIIFDNINFKGSNARTFNLVSADHIQINNCDIKFSGINGVYATDARTNNISLNNDSVSYTNNNAITTENAPSWTITNCYFNYTGTVRGAGMSGDGAYECLSYINGLIQDNVILNSGYLGIHFQGDSTVIRNNFIDSFGLCKTDVGGIYTFGETTKHGRKVVGNIVINGIGDNYGLGKGVQNNTNGIYMDGSTSNVIIDSNTVCNCDQFAFLLNGVTNIEMSYNTDFNCGQGAPNNGAVGGELRFSDQGASGPILPSLLNVKHNISVAKDSAQTVLFVTFSNYKPSAVSIIGTLDSNYYCRPIWEPSNIDTVGYNGHLWNDGGIANTFSNLGQLFKSLDKWQKYSRQDVHTHKSPKTISDTRDIRFEYNASSTNKRISLGSNYIDVLGKSYPGTITLAPYSSAVLIKSGPVTNQPTKANASNDQTIILPSNSITFQTVIAMKK